MASDLLQEGDEVAGAPFVGFGQVDVFEVQHQPLAVFGPVYASRVGADDQTGVREFLQDVTGGRLSAAVHYGHLRGAELRERTTQEHPDTHTHRCYVLLHFNKQKCFYIFSVNLQCICVVPFPASLRPHQQERLPVIGREPRGEEVESALRVGCVYDREIVWVIEVVRRHTFPSLQLIRTQTAGRWVVVRVQGLAWVRRTFSGPAQNLNTHSKQLYDDHINQLSN